jgi:DNA repair protein RadC
MMHKGFTPFPEVALPEAEEGFDFLGPAPAASDSGKAAGEGHRARLRARLLTGGAEALADY